jgi:hypothetical protein
MTVTLSAEAEDVVLEKARLFKMWPDAIASAYLAERGHRRRSGVKSHKLHIHNKQHFSHISLRRFSPSPDLYAGCARSARSPRCAPCACSVCSAAPVCVVAHECPMAPPRPCLRPGRLPGRLDLVPVEEKELYPAGTARGIHVRWLSSKRSRLTATG